MIGKNTLLKRHIVVWVAAIYCIVSVGPVQVMALSSDEQRRLYQSNILYYDLNACDALQSSATNDSNNGLAGSKPGKGDPTGLGYPNLAPTAMANAINKYIEKNNSKSVFKGLGETFVKGGEKSNVNPFLLVAIAQKESRLGDPSDFNVKNGNNAFGRTALASQPNFQGSRTWYYWSSAKASIDPSAPENKRPSGDHAAYMKAVYEQYINTNDIDGFMNKYAPPHENDTRLYVKQLKQRMNELAELAKADNSAAADATEAASSSGTTTTSSSDQAVKQVYMIGDSITVGAKPYLEKNFEDNDITAYINGSVSRSVERPGTTPGYKTSGLAAIEQEPDKTKINSADAIIIALGTNADGDGSRETYINNIKTMVSNSTKGNESATVFVVNVFSPAVGKRGQYNEELKKAAPGMKVQIIDTVNQNIKTSDNIHPNEAGKKIFADLVTGAVLNLTSTTGSGDEKQAPVGGTCVCTSATGTTSIARGSNNAQIIFNFFVDKGWKPYQAAAIVGNMTHESGLEPLRQEGIFNRLVKAEEYRAPGGGPGWGLVQWTPATKMIEPVKKAGKDPNDIIVQLEFLLDQLEGRGPVPEKQAGEEVKGTPNLEEAVKAFQGTRGAGGQYFGYERPADQSGSIPQRTQAARDTLKKYGNGADEGAGGGVASTTGCNSTGNGDSGATGEVVGDLAWPVPIKYVNSNFQWFTKDHHDHPATDIPVPTGTDVFSMTSGKVLHVDQTGPGAGFGAFLTIEVSGVLFRYQHAQANTIKVKVGDEVRPGQLIMKSGNTGFSTGPHLHISIEAGGNSPTYRGLKAGGNEYCPQGLFIAMKNKTAIPSFKDLDQKNCIGPPL